MVSRPFKGNGHQSSGVSWCTLTILYWPMSLSDSAHEGHEQDRAQAANPNRVPTLVLYKRTRLTRKSTQVPQTDTPTKCLSGRSFVFSRSTENMSTLMTSSAVPEAKDLVAVNDLL
ncbi:hypothetical protein AMECASPLE_012625 [Ameca splendens]|uniref:Uncharacterized protein n=1 Tax=Ameca splendens TaxID=208324 RepID=A0ABV0ZNG5_9TELE